MTSVTIYLTDRGHETASTLAEEDMQMMSMNIGRYNKVGIHRGGVVFRQEPRDLPHQQSELTLICCDGGDMLEGAKAMHGWFVINGSIYEALT